MAIMKSSMRYAMRGREDFTGVLKSIDGPVHRHKVPGPTYELLIAANNGRDYQLHLTPTEMLDVVLKFQGKEILELVKLAKP